MERVKSPIGHFIIYGISDCPACLRACAAAMDAYPSCEYIFVNMDFSESRRTEIKKKYNMITFPIIIFEENDEEKLIGGYEELSRFMESRKQYDDYSTPILEKRTELI